MRPVQIVAAAFPACAARPAPAQARWRPVALDPASGRVAAADGVDAGTVTRRRAAIPTVPPC